LFKIVSLHVSSQNYLRTGDVLKVGAEENAGKSGRGVLTKAESSVILLLGIVMITNPIKEAEMKTLTAPPKKKSRKNWDSEDTRFLNDYLDEMGRVKLLTKEEEKDLARRARLGDEEARETLVASNLRFVVSIAKTYRSPKHSILDLVNEGNLGLIRAARRFDERKGVRFISYAIWYIKQAILRSISEHSRAMRLPTNVTDRIKMVNKALDRMIATNGKEPTMEELASELGLDLIDVKKAMYMAKTDLSIDATAGDEEDGDSLSAFIESNSYPAPEETLMLSFLREDLGKAFQKYLNSREAQVLKLYYGLEGEKSHTLESIGRMFGLSRERIRQTKEAALKKLRESPNTDLLRSYLN
jgi:RNA polymerase primary sigma factor